MFELYTRRFNSITRQELVTSTNTACSHGSSYHLRIVLDLICFTHPPIRDFPPTHEETTHKTFPSVQKLPNQAMALLTSLQTPSDLCISAIKNNLPLIQNEIYKCRKIKCSGTCIGPPQKM